MKLTRQDRQVINNFAKFNQNLEKTNLSVLKITQVMMNTIS